MIDQNLLYVVMTFSVVFAVGMVAMAYYSAAVVNGISRNPSAAGDIKGIYLILGAFIELGMLLGFIICLIVLFVVK
jgi:F0F1-type ATP synthase membrane subunit c/vacuolar-type H+-ATPase subunit K